MRTGNDHESREERVDQVPSRQERTQDQRSEWATAPNGAGIGAFGADQVLHLQRAAGNRATTGLLGGGRGGSRVRVARLAQSPTTVGPSESAAESGAQALAPAIENVLAGGEAPTHVPTVSSGSTSSGKNLPSGVGAEIDSARSGGSGLPSAVQEQVGAALSVDLSSVRLHTDERADQLAADLNAKAFTSGSDIFVRGGESRVAGADGRHTLAHELAHVVRGDAGSQVRRLTDDERTQLLGRAARLDYSLLTELAERAPLLVKLNELKGSGNKEMRETEQVDQEMLKQLVLTSARSSTDIDSLIGAAVASPDPTRLRQKLRTGKLRPSGSVYKMMDDCRGLLNDYYRAEQAKGTGATSQEFVAAAKKYDSDKSTQFEDQLTHTTTYRKFGLFKKTRTETHTLEDVVQKARTVAGLDLRHTNSPESMPRQPGDGGEMRRGRVGVVGGGPIGLMAALEARLQGVDVILFEARTDEYSRRQVLALDESTIQKFAKFGIQYELLKDPDRKGDGNLVAVKYIEKALRSRAVELGIDIRTGWFLAGAKEGEDGKTTKATFQVGLDKRRARIQQEELDLLVVAAGAGLSRANKYTGAVLGDELGFKFDVKEARDYAVVGLFESSQKGGLVRSGANESEKRRWAYRFNTPKITYVLQQIPPELYKEFHGEEGKKKMEEFIKKIAVEHYKMEGATFGKDKNKKGQSTPNVGMFPIEIQQARTFVNESLRTLLIGDSAATPHPHTGSGLNTGVRELDALSDVVAGLRTEIALRSQGGEKGNDSKDGSEGESEDPGIVSGALKRYNDEIKGLTDYMIGRAMDTLAKEHAKYLTESIGDLKAQYGNYLNSDYASGERIKSIEETVKKVTAKESIWSKDNQISYLLDAQKEVARIRSELETLVSK